MCRLLQSLTLQQRNGRLARANSSKWRLAGQWGYSICNWLGWEKQGAATNVRLLISSSVSDFRPYYQKPITIAVAAVTDEVTLAAKSVCEQWLCSTGTGSALGLWGETCYNKVEVSPGSLPGCRSIGGCWLQRAAPWSSQMFLDSWPIRLLPEWNNVNDWLSPVSVFVIANCFGFIFMWQIVWSYQLCSSELKFSQ